MRHNGVYWYSEVVRVAGITSRSSNSHSTLLNKRNIRVSIGDIVRARDSASKTDLFLVTNVSRNGQYFKGLRVVDRLPKTVKHKNAIELPYGAYALLTEAYIDIDFEDVIELSCRLGFKVGMRAEREFKGGRHWKSSSRAAKIKASGSGVGSTIHCTLSNNRNIRVSIGDLVLIRDTECRTELYLATYISKDGRRFRGMRAVYDLQPDEPVDNVMLLPNGAYALISETHSNIDMEEVVELSWRLGLEVGAKAERAYQSRRRPAKRVKRPRQVHVLTSQKRVQPMRMMALYHGGVCRPR